MAHKKLPTGISIKTIIEEVGLLDMFRWQIWQDGKQIKESIIRYDDRTEARNDGVKHFHKIHYKL